MDDAETSLEVSSSTVDGLVARGGSRAGSSSSSSVVRKSHIRGPREGSLNRSRALAISSSSGGPARRAVSGGEGMEIANTELETAPPDPQPSSAERGPLPGPQISRIFAARQGDHVENTQHNQSFHDGRRVELTQNILQQVDQRQVHMHTDHHAVLEAAAAVTVANERVAAVENQALQAVLAARGQAEQTVAQVHAQAEVLSVRFAAELQLAHQRENVLREQLEETRQQLARMQEQLDEEKMRRFIAETDQNKNPHKLYGQNTETDENKNPHMLYGPQNGAGNTEDHSLLRRLEVVEREQVQMFDLLQELWSEVVQWRSWSPTVQGPSEQGPTVEPQVAAPQFHRMHSDTDDDEDVFATRMRAGDHSPGTSPTHEDVESQHVKQKDLHYLKVPSLPESAGAFRAWRNSMVPLMASFDRSPNGAVHEWIMEAFRARSDVEIARLQQSSGDYPRFDRVLASALTRPEHLKSHFGLKFQAFLEDSEALNRPLRGRVLLNMVAREFDTDSTYGAVVSELELFSLPPPEGSVASLKAWRDKVRYILGQLPTSERPAEKLMAKWLFERLKKVPALRRHTDRVRDAAEGTTERSFEWLWSRLDRTILENQQEQNLQSIQEALKKGPKKESVGGAAAPSVEQKQKEAEAAKAKAAAAKTAPSKADAKGGKGNKDNKGKGKGQGKDDGKKGGSKSSDPNVKKALSEGLCLFFQKGACKRDNCPFKHELVVPANPAPEAKAKAAAPKAPTKAAVALVMAAMASGAAALSQGPTCTLDVIADTGAGEHLGSKEAFREQGVSESVFDAFCGTSSQSMAFDTGGGKKHSSETIGLWSSSLKRLSNMFVLKSCPLVYSIGQIVMNQGFSFMWEAGELPILIPPAVPYNLAVDRDQCRTADRIEHCVPVFREEVELVSGAPVVCRSEDAREPPDDLRLASGKVGWQKLRDGRVLVQRRVPTFAKPDVEALDLRTTWLVNTTEWFPLENQVKWQELENPEAELPYVAHSLITFFESSASSARRARVVEERKDEGDDDDEWVNELEPGHFLTHLPKSRKCNVCLQAKLTATPHRRRDNQSSNLQEARNQEEPEGPGERIEVDHIIARDAPTEEDEVVSLVCRDRFSGVVWTYPALSKDSEEVEDALRHFCGRKSPIVSVASDRAPEILKAIRDVGFNSEPAVPRDPLHNPFAESAIRTIKQGTATLLLQSGMHVRHWKFAQRCFAFMCNATLEPPKAIQELAKEKGQALCSTRFEAHWKYPYEGYLIPFGALVWYKEREAGTFAPKGEPALYLGPEVIDGMRFKGAHQVVTMRSIKDGAFRVVITKDLAVPNGKWSFPLAKAKALDEQNPHHQLPSIDSLAPPAGALDEDIEQPTPGKPRVDDVGPRAEATRADETSEKVSRNRAITKSRIAVHGKTPKCDGCRSGSYNHNKVCRKRFNDLLNFHEPLPAKDKEDEALEDVFVPPEESEVPAFTPPSTEGTEVGETVSGLAACVELLADPEAHQAGELTEEVAQQLFQGLPQETIFCVDC